MWEMLVKNDQKHKQKIIHIQGVNDQNQTKQMKKKKQKNKL